MISGPERITICRLREIKQVVREEIQLIDFRYLEAGIGLFHLQYHQTSLGWPTASYFRVITDEFVAVNDEVDGVNATVVGAIRDAI